MINIDWHGIIKKTETGWKYPYINPDTGTWWQWSEEQNAYVNTEINALGYTGDTGAQGERGPQGESGTSVYVTSITPSSVDGGANVVTFSDGTTMTVYNGSTGAAGPAGRDGIDGLPGSDGSVGPQGPKGDPGTPGAGVTVVDVSESDVDGGSNIVTFSDGSVLAVKNGSRGERGPAGVNGVNGLPGAAGATGPQGVKGDKGDPGTSVYVIGVSESDVDGGTNIVTLSDGTVLSIKNGNTGAQGQTGLKGNTGEQGPKGDPGDDGVTPHFSIGTVAKGVDPVVTVTGTDAEPVLNFILPKGDAYEITSADYQEIAGIVTEDIAEIKNDAIDAIEQKGEEVLESIPSSYTALSNKVDAIDDRVEVLEPAATSSDVGKMLAVKTVSGGKATSYEFAEASGGGGGSFYGACTTPAATQTKEVTVDNSFALEDGAVVHVKFTYYNSHSSAKLNVNSTGAKAIKLLTGKGVGTVPAISWLTGEVVTFVYDSSLSSWMICGQKYMYSYYNPYYENYNKVRPAMLEDGDGNETNGSVLHLSFHLNTPVLTSTTTATLYGGFYTADREPVYVMVYEYDGEEWYWIQYSLMENEFGDFNWPVTNMWSAAVASDGDVDIEVNVCYNDTGYSWYFCKQDGTPLRHHEVVWYYGTISFDFS